MQIYDKVFKREEKEEESQKFLPYLVKNASGCQPLAFVDSVQLISISTWFGFLWFTQKSHVVKIHIF